MSQSLIVATETAVLTIDALALVIIVVGMVECSIKTLRKMFYSPPGDEKSDA